MSYTTGLTPSGLPQPNDSTQTGSISGSARTSASTRTGASRNTPAEEVAADSAKVSLAGTMLSGAAIGSDVRFEKVAALRQSIEAGTYSVPSDAVASKIVDSLLK